MASAPEPAVQRLFFGLWPSDEVRGRLNQVARDLVHKNGRRVPGTNLHATLVFLGSVDAQRRVCMEQAASAVRGAPFSLALNRVGHWPRPRVLWLGPESTPDALVELAADLMDGLRPCGYQPEPRPYRVHITLARKVSRPVAARTVEPIVWTVEHFCLVESVTAAAGARYRVLKTWPLAQGPA